MTEFEKNVTHYEKLIRRLEKADKKLSKKEREIQRRGGVFAGGADRESLPSAFLKARGKKEDTGLFGGRLHESGQKQYGQKIKPETEKEKRSITDAVMNALGIKSAREESLTKGSLVGDVGAPVKKKNAFKKLQKDVKRLQTNQEAFAKLATKGQALVQGAANLSPAGLLDTGIVIASKHPIVAVVMAVALAGVYAYLSQYGPGGTRDRRKKYKAEDDSLIGVDNENVIASGENLFFSNPSSLQGMPRGNSNTVNLRDGIARYDQRHQGSY